MFYGLYEFQCGLAVSDLASCAHTVFPCRAQWKCGCLYVELEPLNIHLISDSHYVSDSSPRGSITASFHCNFQSPELCCLSALCVTLGSPFDCAASFLCIADAAGRCWQRRWFLILAVASCWHARPGPSPSQGFVFRTLCHILNNPQSQRWHSYCGHFEYILWWELESACHTIIQSLMPF